MDDRFDSCDKADIICACIEVGMPYDKFIVDEFYLHNKCDFASELIKYLAKNDLSFVRQGKILDEIKII